MISYLIGSSLACLLGIWTVAWFKDKKFLDATLDSALLAVVICFNPSDSILVIIIVAIVALVTMLGAFIIASDSKLFTTTLRELFYDE